MAWDSSGQGSWRRELGGLQKTYLLTSRAFGESASEHWGLYAVCEIDFALTKDASSVLRNAWKILRVEFPGLGVILDGCNAVYNVQAKDTDVEVWAIQTFFIDVTKTANDVIAKYPKRDLPALFWLPKTSEVILLISHWRVDATGCLLLLDRLFSIATEQMSTEAPPLGEHDLTRISPSMEDAAGAPNIPTADIVEKSKDFLANFQRKVGGTIGMRYLGNPSTPPNDPASQLISFTTESSEALLSACKRLRISVSAAVYAALASAAFNLGTKPEAEEYATIMAVNMRPYLNPPFNKPIHVCQPYVSSVTPTVFKSQSFEETATSLTQYFKSWHTEEFDRILRQVYKTISSTLMDAPKPSSPPRDPPSGITLSSLGIIENLLKGQYHAESSIYINGFRFGVSMLTRQMLLYLWTFRGQVHLSMNYNDAYYPHGSPRSVLKHIQSSLSKNLNIELLESYESRQ